MNIGSAAALFATMAILACIPSVSVLYVTARSATYGLTHGVLTSLGIVVGDILFILIAVYGLSILAGLMGTHFVLVKYLGGAYLIWFGTGLLRAGSMPDDFDADNNSSLLSSFMSGLLITLGDHKAILFYLGFFPAFLDLPTASVIDTGIIILIAVVAVGGVKLVYAFIADRAGCLLTNARSTRMLNMFAGIVMTGAGGLVIINTIIAS